MNRKLAQTNYNFSEMRIERRQGDSYAAWSIGPDGKDDSGQSIARRKRAKRLVIYPESLGDYVAAP